MMSLSVMGHGRSGGAYHVADQAQAIERQAAADYYTLDSTDQPGQWYSTCPAGPVRNGAEVSVDSWLDLCEGKDPRGGKGLIKGAGAEHRAGLDLTFSAPKSVSLLRAQADAAGRVAIDKMQLDSVRDALKFIEQEGLLEVRLGAGGIDRQRPAGIIAGLFTHQTSRAGDPNLHVHAAVLNVAESPDGQFRTIAAERLFQNQKVVGAAYRASLSRRLHEAGLVVEPAHGRMFEVAGIQPEVIERFSKRSGEIEAALGGDRAGSSAAMREQVALQTRAAKSELPAPDELQARWKSEFEALGATDLWADARKAAREPRQVEANAVIEQFSETPAVAGDDPVGRAASERFRSENVLSRAALLESAFVAASLKGQDPGQVRTRIDTLLKDNQLIELRRGGEAYYTTSNIAESEATLIEAVSGRSNERDWFQVEAIDKAIGASPFPLADEQKAALRQVADRSGVSILEAAAGSGKTSSVAAPLVSAAERSGLNLIGLAPSHRARLELQQVGMNAQTTSKFLAAMASESPPKLDSKSIVVIDEAGMVSCDHLSKVAAIARDAGAKLILIGDSRQLESVSGGAGLRLVNRTVGPASTLREIKRQRETWMREASMQMAQGRTAEGLQAYSDRGHIALIDGQDRAIAEAIDSWSAQRAEFGQSILISQKNSDVDRLNLVARERLRTEGQITGPDQALAIRDRDGKPAEIQLAEGDQIVFRENVADKRIFNRDSAVVLSVSVSANRLKVRMADGRVIAGAPTDFAQQPEKRGGRGRPPKARQPRLEHGYASSVYGTQGTTVPAATVYISNSNTSRTVYVSGTRHRDDVRFVVERGQIEARVRAGLKRGGEDHRQQLSEDRLLARLSEEAAISNSKVNVTDFLGPQGMKKFLERGATTHLQPHASFRQALGLVGGLARAISGAIDRGRRAIKATPTRALIFDRQVYEWAQRAKHRDLNREQQNKTARHEWDGPSW